MFEILRPPYEHQTYLVLQKIYSMIRKNGGWCLIEPGSKVGAGCSLAQRRARPSSYCAQSKSYLSDHAWLVPLLDNLSQDGAQDHDKTDLYQVQLNMAVDRRIAADDPTALATFELSDVFPRALHDDHEMYMHTDILSR